MDINQKLTVFLDFLRFEKRFSSHTLKAYKVDLGQFFTYLKNQIDISTIQEVTHIHIRSWIVDLVQSDISSRSINRKLSALKSFYKYMNKRGEVSFNPVAKIVAPKAGKRLPITVKENNLKHLFSLLANETELDFPSIRDRMVVEVLYQTGIRRSELIALKLHDIDYNGQTIKVLGKGGKERLIPISRELSKDLQLYLDYRKEAFKLADPFLFLTNSGKRMYPKFVYNLVKKVLSLVTTIDKRSPHVLRHSFATHLSDRGASLNAIKGLLGHSNLAATQVYMHNSIERLRSVYLQAHPKAKEQDYND